MKKWYIIYSTGENDNFAVVELTNEEYTLLKGIFKQSSENTIISEPYAGCTELVNHAFNTREEAITYCEFIQNNFRNELYDTIDMFAE